LGSFFEKIKKKFATYGLLHPGMFIKVVFQKNL
jgi:hypothetical protein